MITILGNPFYKLMGENRVQVNMNLLPVERVLVVRLDEIGDVVMTTPFLRELRRIFSTAWITLVVKPTVYNLVELCPYVDEVLTYNWRAGRFFRSLQRHWRALILARKHLWRRRFDLAILPRWDIDYYHGAFLAYCSGAPRRVGYSENVIATKKRLNRGLDRLLTHVLEDNTLKHEVRHNLDVIRFLGGEVENERLELWTNKGDEAFAEEMLRDHDVKPSNLLIGIGPGAGARKREWPLNFFRELGLWLQKRYAARLFIIGGPGEEQLGQELQSKLDFLPINAVGKTTLRQVTALLRHSSLYIGNDAGPMHIAAAVGVPVVELSCHPKCGSPSSANSSLRFGPWGENHTVIQPEAALPPCEDECIADSPHCILGISVEQVKEAIAPLLSSRCSAVGYSRDCAGGGISSN
jgi:heptosyltransferase-2